MLSEMRMSTRLTFLCLVQMLVAFEFSAINVALPELRIELAIAPEKSSYLLSGYSVAFASTLLFGGRLSSRFGGDNVLFVGLPLFAISSALAAISFAFGPLLVARILQGVFAAVCAPAALSVITELSPIGDRNRLIGYWGGAGAAGFALGVTASGIVVQFAGWPMIFWICALLAIMIFAALRVLLSPIRNNLHRSPRDLRGSILFAFMSAAFVAMLATSVDPSVTQGTVGLIGLFAIVLSAIFMQQQRRAITPEFPPGFLSRQNIWSANLLGCVATIAGGSMVFLTSDLILNQLGWSPATVGVIFIPDAIAAAYGAKLAAPLSAKFGFIQTIVKALLSIALGMATLSITPENGGSVALTLIIVGSSLVGFGLVLAAASTTIEASRILNKDEHGLSAGLINATQQWGIGLGTVFLIFFGDVGYQLFSLDPVRFAIFGGCIIALACACVSYLMHSLEK